MKVLSFLFTIIFLTSCSASDNEIQNTVDNGSHTFERDFVTWTFNKNTSDNLKIDISTVIDVHLENDDYTNGLYLVVLQNFRYKTSAGVYNPAEIKDTIFISNLSDRQYILNGYIEYSNPSLYIEDPEVIMHHRNFTFFRP